MDVDIDKRVVLITGAAAGIGRASAKRLADEGWRIAAVDVNQEGLQTTISYCRSVGAEAEFFVCDITKDKSIAKMYSLLKKRWNTLDTIVHCAGVGRYAPFLDLQIEDWQKMIDINLLGIVRLTQATLGDMLSQGSGRIIILGSRRGLEPAPGTSAYSASKAALVGFSRGLAQEVGSKGIQVCLIAPGGVKTDFGGVPSSEKDSRYLDASTIAESVAHIANTSSGTWIRELTIIPLEL